MSNVLMMMPYGAYFVGGGDYTPNLIQEPYFTESSTRWYSVSHGSTESHGHPDESGGNNAVKITFVGPDNHQIWYDLQDASGNILPLTEGKAYVLTAYMREDVGGVSEPMQMAYYTGGDSLTETEVTIDANWNPYEFRFIAQDDYEDDPSIRLIGWGQGLDGESVFVGRVNLQEMQVEGDGQPIITENQITSGSSVWSTTSSMIVTENVADSQGGMTATRIELLDPNSHHLEYLLPEALTVGSAYTLSMRMRIAEGATFTGDFQFAYYDDGSEVQGLDLTPTHTWETYHYKFIAREASDVDPTIRLIGYSNGAAGDIVEIESVHLVEGTDPAIE